MADTTESRLSELSRRLWDSGEWPEDARLCMTAVTELAALRQQLAEAQERRSVDCAAALHMEMVWGEQRVALEARLTAAVAGEQRLREALAQVDTMLYVGWIEDIRQVDGSGDFYTLHKARNLVNHALSATPATDVASATEAVIRTGEGQ